MMQYASYDNRILRITMSRDAQPAKNLVNHTLQSSYISCSNPVSSISSHNKSVTHKYLDNVFCTRYQITLDQATVAH